MIESITQWAALLGLLALLATLGWRVWQRDQALAEEVRRQQRMEGRLGALELRLDAHIAAHRVTDGKLDRIASELHDVRERVVRIETRLDHQKG